MSLVGRRRNDQIRTCTWCRNTEDEKLLWLRDLTDSMRFQTHIALAQAWGPIPRRRVPLASLKASGIFRWDVRNQNSTHEECAHLFAHYWGKGTGRRYKIPRTLPVFHDHLCMKSGQHCNCSSPLTWAQLVPWEEAAIAVDIVHWF